MKTKAPIAALALLRVCAVAGPFAQDEVTLRRQLKTNAHQVYKVQTDTEIGLDDESGHKDGGVKAFSFMRATIKSVAKDGSKGDYTVTNESDRLEKSGLMDNPQVPDKYPTLTWIAKLDALNRLSDVRVTGPDTAVNEMSILGGAQSAQLGLYIEFPQGPVKIGETWTVNVPTSVMTGKTPQTLTARFLGPRLVDGVNVNAVSLAGTFVITPDPAKSSQGLGVTVTIKGTADINTENLLDATTGELIQATGTVKGRLDEEIVQLSKRTRVTSNTTLKIVRAP